MRLTAMHPLFSIALLLFAPTIGLDECKTCKKGKVCTPHVKFEASEIKRLRGEFESDSIDDRIEALNEIAALTFEHENVPSARVAKILVTALEGGSLRVREAAIELLTDGQHAGIAVPALVEVMDDLKRNMYGLVPWLAGKKGVRGTSAEAMSYIETVMRVSSQVPDDRVLKALANVLAAMPWEMYGQPVAMAATRSLLELGTPAAVRAVLRQFNSQSGSDEMQAINDALTDFALDLEFDDAPEYGKDASKQWNRWLKKHVRSLPSKLGKWRGKRIDEDDEDDEEPSEAEWRYLE